MKTDFSLLEARVAVLGLGLMGGSLALALRGHCHSLTGYDSDPATLEAALSRHVVDRAAATPASAVKGADVVLLSAPVPAILHLLDELPAWIPGPCIVLDIGSSKCSITQAMGRLPERFEAVGGHPLCGKEVSSLANAEAGLFRGAPFMLTCSERTTPRALSAARQIVAAVRARELLVDPVQHDQLLAFTSHMPFLLASALVSAAPQDCQPFIGPGFRSTSRLASTSSAMMLGVLLSNRENVLSALHRLQDELTQIASALELADDAHLDALLQGAQSKYRELTR